MNYILTDEGHIVTCDDSYLMHYGVPGMRWGHKKAQAEYDKYRSARKEMKTARKAMNKAGYTMGIKGLEKHGKAEKAYNKARLKQIDAKAEYARAKSKNADKAEEKVYRREMAKTGLVGSAADRASRGQSSDLYNHIKVKKGKEYADRVHKKVQNRAIAEFATGVTVMLGSSIVSGYLQYKNS